MPQKTIYLPESVLPVWDRAQKELGESLSALVVDCLKRKLEWNEALGQARALGVDRIVLRVIDPEHPERSWKKAFWGRWLVNDIRPQGLLHKDYGDGVTISAAVTRKGAIAVFWKDDEMSDRGRLYVYTDFQSFKDAREDGGPANPENLVSIVAAALGREFEEELDI